ncbi:sugar kinase [Candidatus Sumerlaeota bacterium]|nr:PfkB family carbohydrate kinase [Candidatus Sumerlaeales bacterium]NLD62092.1 sugar kinase [Candidatus Sumerlaeota bacterium]
MVKTLILGTLGLDDVETPFGKVSGVQGGSCSYASMSASYFTKVGIVGVIGDDYPQGHKNVLVSHGVDISGVEQVDGGKTFSWGGKYEGDMNSAQTIFTELGVFENFQPIVPEAQKGSPYILLCNFDPIQQNNTLKQMSKPKISILDTMNLWINIRIDALKLVLQNVDVVVMNEGEARMFCKTDHMQEAGQMLLGLGLKRAIIKKGEHGCLMFSQTGDYFVAPAYPLLSIKDPTGAGDTFAGGLIGHLASVDATIDADEEWRRAIIYGTAMASFTCEGFSLSTLAPLTRERIDERYKLIRKLSYIPNIE